MKKGIPGSLFIFGFATEDTNPRLLPCTLVLIILPDKFDQTALRLINSRVSFQVSTYKATNAFWPSSAEFLSRVFQCSTCVCTDTVRQPQACA